MYVHEQNMKTKAPYAYNVTWNTRLIFLFFSSYYLTCLGFVLKNGVCSLVNYVNLFNGLYIIWDLMEYSQESKIKW